MPPNIALLICLLLIAAILRIESKQKIGVSLSICIPLLWVMIAASRALSTWLNPEGMYIGSGDYESGNPIDRAFFSLLIAASLFVLAKRKIAWGEVASKNAWIIALSLLAGLSVIWAGYGEVSFKRWVRSIGVILMVLIVVTEDDPLEASKRLLRRCMYVLIPLSVLFIKYYRHLGVGWDYFGNTMWYGVSTHKNSLGQLACVSAVFLVWNIFENWKNKSSLFWADLLILIMSLWLLRGSDMSTSKTAILLFLLGLFLLMCLKVLKARPRFAGKFLLAVGIFLLSMEILSSLVMNESLLTMLITSSGRDATLTGRTFLWEELMRMASKNPILGTGYGSFWLGGNISHLWEKFGWGPESAHNGFLDVYLELGSVGILFLIVFIVKAYKGLIRYLSVEYKYGTLRIILFSMSIVYNVTESSFLRPSSLLWIILLLVTIQVGTSKEVSPKSKSNVLFKD